MRHLRGMAMAAMVLLGSEVVAESVKDLQHENCIVKTFVDEFTDRMTHTVLACSAVAQGAIARVEYTHSDGGWYITFFDEGRQYDVPDDQAPVQIAFRIDDHPAHTVDGVWFARYEQAIAVLDERLSKLISERILDGPARLIFRVGSAGEIKRIAIPEGIDRLIVELFRRTRGD